jgi:hypothetical protein
MNKKRKIKRYGFNELPLVYTINSHMKNKEFNIKIKNHPKENLK